MFGNLLQTQKGSLFDQAGQPANKFGSQLDDKSNNQFAFNFSSQQKPMFESEIITKPNPFESKQGNMFATSQIQKVEGTNIDPKIAEIERKQKEILEAKKNKQLKNKIIYEEEIQMLLQNPILRRINDRINKVCVQTDIIINLIDQKEENYIFPVSIETIQGEVNKIKEGVKYGNNTAAFQKNLSDLGYICWQTSSQLEQVEIEIKRIEKYLQINGQDLDNSTCDLTQNKNKADNEKTNEQRLQRLDEKLTRLQQLFEQFQKNLDDINLSKDLKEKKNQNDLINRINILQQGFATNCYQPSTLKSKIENQSIENSNISSEQMLEGQCIQMKEMILSRQRELEQTLIKLDIRALDKNCKQQVKGRIELDIDDLDDEESQKNQYEAQGDDFNLIHYQYLKNEQIKQKNGNQQQSRLPTIQLPGRIYPKSKDESSQLKQIQKKVIEFDLDDSSSNSSQEEIVLPNFLESQIRPLHTQETFLQCQSSVMQISFCGSKLQQSSQKNGLLSNTSSKSIKFDPIQHKIQCSVPTISEPLNIRYRENIFKSLKSAKKASQSSDLSGIYLGEQHYYAKLNDKLIPQNGLTPLQYEQLGKEVITKERTKLIITETNNKAPVKQTTPNVQANQASNKLQNQAPQPIANKQLKPKSMGESNIGRMVLSMNEGQPSPTKRENNLEVKTQLTKVNSQYELDENEINNPLYSDDGEEDDEDEFSNSESDEPVGQMNVFVNNKKDKQDIPSNLLLTKNGTSINFANSINLSNQPQGSTLFGGLTSNNNQQSNLIQPNNPTAPTGAKTATTSNKTEIKADSKQQQLGLPQAQPGGLFGNLSTTAPLGNLNNKSEQVKKDGQQVNNAKSSALPGGLFNGLVQGDSNKQKTESSLLQNITKQSGQSSKIASIPPSSPTQAQVKQQTSTGLFGQSAPKKEETKQQVAAQPPSSPTQQQVKQQAQQGLFGQVAPNTSKKDDKKSIATLPPSSPTQAQVKQQTSTGLFGQSALVPKKEDNAQKQVASQPPSSPPKAQVQQQTSLGLFGKTAETKKSDDKDGIAPIKNEQQQGQTTTKTQPFSLFGATTIPQPTQAGSLLNQKPNPPPPAGEGGLFGKPLIETPTPTPAPAPGTTNTGQKAGLFGQFTNQETENKGGLLQNQQNVSSFGKLFNTQNQPANATVQPSNQNSQPGLTGQTGGLFNFSKDSKSNLLNQQQENDDSEFKQDLKKKKLSTEDKSGMQNNQLGNIGNAMNSMNITQNNNQFSLNQNTQQKPNTQGGMFGNTTQQLQNNNPQPSALSNLNFGSSIPNTSGGLFGNTTMNTQNKTLNAFGNTTDIFGGSNSNTNTNMFGFGNQNNQNNAFNKPAQNNPLPSYGFGAGNTMFGASNQGQNSFGNNQQSNQAFKLDISNVQFGQPQQQQQQQQQPQQQQPTQGGGNMFQQFCAPQSGGLFQTGTTNNQQMFGNQGAINTPSINQQNTWNKPRK